MAVLMSLGGNSAGDGFLVAPVGSNYDAELSLSTDAGTLSVTLQASPDAAGLVFSSTSLSLSTTPTIVTVHATLQSASRGDTTIEVLDGATVVASFAVTSIKHPKVNFKGRFEARFATAGAQPFSNVMYTPATVGSPGAGWTWGLEGEPEFVTPGGTVPENLETPGMGRVIRLNDPVALRSHAAAVVSTVDSITGDTTLGTETFFTGDPLIGQPVDFGPDTYFAGNMPSGMPTPEEYYGDAVEPMALFELHFGTLFSGASQVGPFVAKATMLNQLTRTPDSRPIATGLPGAATEMAEFGLPDLPTFSATRIDLLVADFNALPPGDTPERRNLARRVGHLLNAVTAAKRMAVQAANPGAFTLRTGTLAVGWSGKEVFTGKIDANLVFNPGASSVVAYMSEFTSFNVLWEPFSFHSDELCGHHKGSLTHLNSDGSYSGDPHTRTVNGTLYDFQAVGEFTLLRYGARLEIQVRQSPVATQNPITDSYSGLTSCVSVTTAVAARLGSHSIALQPGREGRRLEFYLDGKPANLSAEGIDVDGHRVTGFDANGETGLRVDFEDQTVLTVTPAFWNNHNIWYMNVSVSNTSADEGIMGYIPHDSWLPRLRNGASVGPMPATLQDRYVTLYKKFADSWRVTNKTSLFIYAPGTSTKTFTDTDWPAAKPPCKMKPEFQVPGVKVFKGMAIERAQAICKAVMIDDLNQNCVFDVATTGDEIFARGYLFAQELRLYGTSVRLVAHDAPSRHGRMQVETGDEPAKDTQESLALIATVLPLTSRRPIPTGSVTFYLDGVRMNRPANLDERGRASVVVPRLKPGEHKIRATYSGGGKYDHHSSSSPNLLYTVGRKEGGKEGTRSK
jgi:hypothetical protein